MAENWAQEYKSRQSNAPRITSRMELQLPHIELLGSVQCCVENYNRIIQFSAERIVIEANGGTIHVTGQEMMLSSFTEDCIYIAGRIEQVRYES